MSTASDAAIAPSSSAIARASGLTALSAGTSRAISGIDGRGRSSNSHRPTYFASVPIAAIASRAASASN